MAFLIEVIEKITSIIVSIYGTALLTQIHETRAAEAKPWKMSDADKDYIEQQLASIIGLEIDITGIVGKSKLSQNREPRDRDGAIAALRRRGEIATADAMARAQPPL